MRVLFSEIVEESLGQYYENYESIPSGGTDMVQRSNKYRAIVSYLGGITYEQYTNPTYIKDGINHINISNIGDIGYEVFQEKGLVAVKSILFATNQSNTNSNNFQQNNQIQYQNVSGKPFFGMTMVKSNNGLFNFTYMKNGKKWFFMKEWYKNAKDFAKYHNGIVAGKVFDGTDWWWIYLDGRPKEKEKKNTITSSITPESIQKKKKKLIENAVRNVIEEMFPKITSHPLKYYFEDYYN